MDGEPLAFSLSYFFGRLPHPGWLVPVGLETSNDRYWSASREPQRSMTSRGYDPRQSPGLGYKRVVSCKDSSHGADVLAVSEHGAPGRRPNIHAHFAVAKGRTASIHCRPAPPRQTEALSSRTSRSGGHAAGGRPPH